MRAIKIAGFVLVGCSAAVLLHHHMNAQAVQEPPKAIAVKPQPTPADFVSTQTKAVEVIQTPTVTVTPAQAPVTAQPMAVEMVATPTPQSKPQEKTVAVGLATTPVALVTTQTKVFDVIQTPTTVAVKGPITPTDTAHDLNKYDQQKIIKVGILHSLSGPMSAREKAVVDAEMLAIEEINITGLLGKKLVAVVADGKSDDQVFATEARRLITQEKVAVIFGCWTSASRKNVKAVVEQLEHLLFYPAPYEGLEQSPHIVYVGATPNQHIVPAVSWSFHNLGKRFYLVGSDYIFSKAAHEIIRETAATLHGIVIGESYLPLDSSEVASVVQEIKDKKPAVILNSINGETNVHFFRELRAAGVTIPVMSFSVSELELTAINVKDAAGSYAALNYFQGIARETNREFVQRFKKKYGEARVIGDVMEAGYLAVHLWAQAVRDAHATDIPSVKKSLPYQQIDAPEGRLPLDPETMHLFKFSRIGKIKDTGQFNIVWESKVPVKPLPFMYRPRAEWESFLAKLYRDWGNKWQR